MSRRAVGIKPIDMTPGGYLRWLATTMGDQPAVVADMLEQARRADKMLAALSTVDTMPVDGCSPFVIESMLRQAKTLAYQAIAAAAGDAD